MAAADWARVKSKAQASVKDIADELIKLYAERQATTGYGFSKDSSYQNEFEAMFPYDETRDQLRAIEEIKKDMEKATSDGSLALRRCWLWEDRSCHSCSL